MVEKSHKPNELFRTDLESETDLEYLKTHHLKNAERAALFNSNPSKTFYTLYNQLNGGKTKSQLREDDGQDARKISKALIDNSEIRQKQVLIVASAGKNSGCSQFVLSLANELMQYKKRTVVVDANTVSRGFTRFTRKQSDGYGLTDLLAGEAPVWRCIERLDDSEVFLLERGRLRNNLTRILLERNINELLELFHDLFDFIIIELPPLLTNSSFELWSSQGNALLFIDESNGNHDELLHKFQLQMRQAGMEFWGKSTSSNLITPVENFPE
ncbi:MAG: hypothetical protein DWQ10_12420 [Calditrichaeota bacterium]|nr:MAG: hypothetical protein DWQ10_12420 [Calditrichota bacterium]